MVLILADDLGYGDLGCYGSPVIATPALDWMAREGVRFTDFYAAAPFCSPSRAAILTGRLPVRCGVPYVLFPTEHTGLPPEETTLAEALKTAGFATACVGKWHLGWRREFRPQAQGFDEYYGLLHTNDVEEWTTGKPFHHLSSMEPLSLREGDRVVEAPVDQSRLTERYTGRALDFIRRNRGRPFFLFLSHTMPHIPQHASPAYAGKSRDGVYGDAVEELDGSTGRVLALLRELGIAGRTLVLFTSDNGAGVRGRNPGGAGRFPGRSFGGSNGPLRAGKGTTFEGGIRVPLIAWRPGTLPAGRTESTPASTLDLYPTLLRAAGGVPDPAALDGVDIGGLLAAGAPAPSTRTLFHYFGPQLQAVRQDRWKLIVRVSEPPAPRVPSLWYRHQPAVFERQHRLWLRESLYDLSLDPGEERDVSAVHPEVVARLRDAAGRFDARLRAEARPVRYLPGPRQPAPGEVRTAAHDLGEWAALAR